MKQSLVLIIGATGDVGVATARLFAAQRCSLIVTGRDQTKLDELSADLSVRGAESIQTLVLDVAEQQSLSEFSKTIDELGQSIDLCVCTVGWLGDQKAAESDSTETIHNVWANYLGPVLSIEPIAAKLEEQAHGALVVVSSVAGVRGRQSNYHYGAAKAALITFLEGLRNRMHRSNVHVAEIRPGFVNTRMIADMDTPEALTASADEVAMAVNKAFEKKRHVVYVKPIWRVIMLVIRSIPEIVFKRLSL